MLRTTRVTKPAGTAAGAPADGVALRAARRLVGGVGLAGGMVVAGGVSYLGALRLLDPDLFETAIRLGRVVAVAGLIAADYALALRALPAGDGAPAAAY